MVRASERLDSRFLLAFAMANDTLKAGLASASTLNVTQYRILMMVYQGRPDPTAQASIPDLLHIRPNVVAQAVGVLEAQKLISRKADPNDARARSICITGAGKRHIDKVNSALVDELYRSWPTDNPAFRRILEATVMAGGKIETSIPQTNPDYFPASHVLTITARSTRFIEMALEKLGLSMAEARVLQRLAEVAEPLRMGALASQLQLSGASTTRAVDALAKRGLVKKLASPTDGKAAYAALTEQGTQAAEEAQRVIDREGAAHFWGNMDTEQRKAFRLMGEVVIEDLRTRREAKRKSELDQLVPA